VPRVARRNHLQLLLARSRTRKDAGCQRVGLFMEEQEALSPLAYQLAALNAHVVELGENRCGQSLPVAPPRPCFRRSHLPLPDFMQSACRMCSHGTDLLIVCTPVLQSQPFGHRRLVCRHLRNARR
jgi:hypothetical protein